MKITISSEERERTIFHLNVGGFTIKNCRWFPASRRILFPVRYRRNGHRYRVVHAYGRHVQPLWDLLMSGRTETPRDRRPCNLKIHFRGRSPREYPEWRIFDFTVRGFTILGCRWQPSSGSIQLPVTFGFDLSTLSYIRKQVVCAYGSHIPRLRSALEARWFELTGELLPERTETAVQA